jgi:damage-control phosphatase, subfamily I
MTTLPECYDCLTRLLALTVKLATPDEDLRRRALALARRRLDAAFSPAAIPAAIATRILPEIYRLTHNPDPFAARKAAATDWAARLYAQVSPACRDDLESLLRLAALGNALDFFRDEAELTREIQAQVRFGRDDTPAFRRELHASPGLLLYLADNAGEQFFDRPLVAGLRRRGWQVVYVVKGGPIQNDLTRDDLAASGLQPDLEPVADIGAATVGLDLETAGPAFRQLYRDARLILAKGMGHFETMSHLTDPRLWFLLQAKCTPVARSLEVLRNDLVFCRPPAISLDSHGQTR